MGAAHSEDAVAWRTSLEKMLPSQEQGHFMIEPRMTKKQAIKFCSKCLV